MIHGPRATDTAPGILVSLRSAPVRWATNLPTAIKSASHRPTSLAPAENAIVLHASCAPLVLTLMADAGTNVGLLLDAAPQASFEAAAVVS